MQAAHLPTQATNQNKSTSSISELLHCITRSTLINSWFQSLNRHSLTAKNSQPRHLHITKKKTPVFFLWKATLFIQNIVHQWGQTGPMLHAGVLIEQHSWIGDPLKNKRRQNRDYSVFAYIARQCAYLFSCLLILNTLKKQLSWRFRIWETSGRSFQKEAPYPLCNWRTASLQSVWKLSSLQCEGPFYICRVKGSSRYKDGGRSKWGQVLISLILAVSSVSLLTWSGCVGELTEKANMFELWMSAITSREILLTVHL